MTDALVKNVQTSRILFSHIPQYSGFWQIFVLDYNAELDKQLGCLG